MAKAIPLGRLHGGHQVQTSAPFQPHLLSEVDRQAAIENALSMALYFVRQPDNVQANLWAATARANRALTLLKHASLAAAASERG